MTQNEASDEVKQTAKAEAPEKLRYTRYYEHDGALRAYANRAMLLAFLCVPSTLVALAFAIYVRIQPPTVIRVNEKGEASVVGKATQATNTPQGNGNSEANEFERKAFVRLFLDKYQGFSPDTVNRNWAEALNMMSVDLRRTTFDAIDKNNLVGQIEDDQTRSEFELKSLEPTKEDPLTFLAFAVRRVHHVHDHRENVDQLVEEYHVRLALEKRSEHNPSGLFVAEYWEQTIDGERRNSILAQTPATSSQ